MNTNRIVTSVLAAILLASPLAAAGWSMKGAWEPNTQDDITDGWMWLDADKSSNPETERVYFNAVNAQYAATFLSINSGIVGTRLVSPNLMSNFAYLGVWKDCNHDDYMGIADTAAATYPSVLLVDPAHLATCPIGSEYNDGTDVREFRWIRPTTANGAPHATDILDDAAQVWGDFGRPGGRVHFDCPHEPLPYGTTGSTGGVLMWADCFTQFTATKTITTLLGPGLGFDDTWHPERECDSPLQQDIPIWGNPQREQWCGQQSTGLIEEHDSNQAVTAFDCAAPAHEAYDPTAPEEGQPGQLSEAGIGDENGRILAVAAPVGSPHNPTGSYYSALNQTENVTCGTTPGVGLMEDIVGERAFGFETHFGATNPGDGKRLVDFPMSFAVSTTQGPRWASNLIYLSPTYNGGTVRNNLEPAGAMYFTFYARTGTNTTDAGGDLPVSASATYASEVCGSTRSGVVNDWDCDPSHWWRPDLGGYAWPGAAYGTPIRPGETSYNLRDVDCYDGSLMRGVPVYTHPTAISNDGPCV